MFRGGQRTPNNLIVDVESLKRKFHRIFVTGAQELDVNGEMLEGRVPIHFGGLSDPFSNMVVSKKSRELLNLLSMYDYPVVMITKNTNELVKDQTLRILKEMKNLVLQISISTSEEELAKQLEPNVPSPKQRIDCIRRLVEEGIYTVVRLQPLFSPWIGRVVDDLIPLIGSTKCRHVIVEHLKLPVERRQLALNTILSTMGWDAYEFYRDKGSMLVGREWVLPHRFRWEQLEPVTNAINRHGMTYGAADYGLTHLGDTECCCGISKLEGFSHWFKGNFTNAVRDSSGDRITFNEVGKHWIPRKSIKMYMNSNCRMEQGNSILDYLRHKWNMPGTTNAPDSFLGVSWQRKIMQVFFCKMCFPELLPIPHWLSDSHLI